MSTTNSNTKLTPRKELAQFIFDVGDSCEGFLMSCVLQGLDSDCTKMMRECLGVGNRRMINKDGTENGTEKKDYIFNVEGAGVAGINGIYVADGNQDGVAKYSKKGMWRGEEEVFIIYRRNSKTWYISNDDINFYKAPATGAADEVPQNLRWCSLEQKLTIDSDSDSDSAIDDVYDFDPPPSTKNSDFSLKVGLKYIDSRLPPRKVLAKYLSDLDSDNNFSHEVLEMINNQCSEILHSTSGRVECCIHQISCETDNEGIVRSLLRKFPKIISTVNKDGNLPIHSAAASKESVSFVPILAEQYLLAYPGTVSTWNRGGLLSLDSTGCNVFEALTCTFSEYDPSYDIEYTKVVKRLRKMKLFSVQDIKQFNLLTRSCHPWSSKRFNVIFEMSSGAQIRTLLHDLLSSLEFKKPQDDIRRISLALKASMERYPQHVGFLFHEDDEQFTAFEIIIENFGKDRAMEMVKECIPTHSKFPILHHVLSNIPEYTNDFAKHYPSAMFLKDENKRAFHHIAISSGYYNFNTNALFLIALSDEKIEERDPYLDLYPFMSAAAAKSSDLTTIFYLLQRCPWVLDESHRMNDMNVDEEQKRRPSRKKPRKTYRFL